MLDKTTTRFTLPKEKCKTWLTLDKFQPLTIFLESSPTEQYAPTKIQFRVQHKGSFKLWAYIRHLNLIMMGMQTF